VLLILPGLDGRVISGFFFTSDFELFAALLTPFDLGAESGKQKILKLTLFMAFTDTS
jgi:hypothetical protein